MSRHPYAGLPPYRYWQSIETSAFGDVDPVVTAKFKIDQSDRIATAGSCFAQNIARYLTILGFNHFVTETAHPLVPEHLAEAFGYGVFPARFGNIYTSAQLLQLLKRSYGLFTPAENIWMGADGRVIDPFRPRIQPEGFASISELTVDRRQHFAAVRRMVEEMDVFAFTLGLTEGWVSRADGAAFPLCPGVICGEFDPQRHRFDNPRSAQILAEMQEAFDFIRARNRAVKFIVTVSPVPLVATGENRSVLVSTAYSKSALRVVCEELAGESEDVAYFPACEIITGNHARGRYFAEDLRSVTDDGISHVMRLFFEHYTDLFETRVGEGDVGGTATLSMPAEIERVSEIICEEEALAHRPLGSV